MDIFKSCIDRQKRIDKVVEILKNDDIRIQNLLIKDRIINPSHYIVMLGETSSGKSALINTIFDKKILVENVKPTTGVVTEVVIDEKSEETLVAINNDLSVEILDNDKFSALTLNPHDNINRLRYIGACKNERYNGMRIFDTPGYGSLIERHEEILKEFIPESDFIVYVVSYRTGIGDDDFQFLKYVGEIINDNVEVVLAINMCPQDTDDKNPAADKLWNYIYAKVNEPGKLKELSETLKSYQDYILRECDIKINSRIAEIENEKENTQEKVKVIKEFIDEKENILNVIEEGFAKIKLKAVRLIGKSDIKVKEDISKYIYDESKWSMKEETFALMQHYYVPKLTSEETDVLNNYIEDEVVSLDRIIDSMLNSEIAKLKENVNRKIPSYGEVVEGVIEKHIGNSVEKAAGEIFRRAYNRNSQELKNGYVGSKNLKKLANTFERSGKEDKNNNLNHLLKTIRATSLKGITESLSIFTDSIFFLYDSLTWQKKVEEISMNAIDKWANDVEGAIRKYLDELKETNKDEILALFEELNEEFSQNKKELENISSEELVRIKKEIEFLLYKCLLINLKSSKS
jgi:predicted GTPase